jgi:phage shock protein E
MTYLLYAVLAIFLYIRFAPMLRNALPGQREALRTKAVNGAVLLDVRTPAEHASGHITNSFNIPVQQLNTRLNELPTDKNIPIIVYCASGVRSGTAAGILKVSGYTDVTNGGGYADLKNALDD